jgi:hypothetical protein
MTHDANRPKYRSPSRSEVSRSGRVLAGCTPFTGQPTNRAGWRRLAKTLRAKGITNAKQLEQSARDARPIFGEALDDGRSKPHTT